MLNQPSVAEATSPVEVTPKKTVSTSSKPAANPRVATTPSQPKVVDLFDPLTFDNIPEQAPEIDLTELLEAGVHFGHQASRWSPKMKEYIYMEKGGVHIFDLAQTAKQLQQAYNVAYLLGKQGKMMIMVGTKKQAKEVVEEVAQEHAVPYITSRWLGGLLTNWDQVRNSLKRMNEIKDGLASGKFKSYTKYERVQLEKEMSRLQRFFVGIQDLKQRPDALFVIDAKREKIAVREANAVRTPVIAIVDSNTDPDAVQVVIPGNDDAQRSIKTIVEVVAKGYAQGRKDASK